MILQELVRFYERQRNLQDSDIAPPGWIRRPLDYIIVLRDDGQCVDLQPLFTVENGKRVGRPELLPSIGKQALKHTNSGKDANLLWDNASFVLGVGNRGAMKLESFIQTINHWFPGATDVGVRAVGLFLRSLQTDPAKANALIERFSATADFDDRDPVLAFRLASDGPINVHERETARRDYAAQTAALLVDAVRGRCLVTGATDVPLALNETVLKGVWNSQPAGANLVSFNAAAFISYGKLGRTEEIAPVGSSASAVYSTSLNFLLASPRNRVQVGDASTVFWADSPSRFDGEFTLADFFGENKDDPGRGVRAVQALFEALKGGQLPVAERDVQFFVLGLAPNAARISVRFWLRAPLSELAPRIAQHFDDLRIVRCYDSDPVTPSLFRLLRDLALQRKLDNVPPRLAGEWMRAILEGLPYPALLLNAAVIRCKAEQDVTYLRAAVLKAWLNRDHRRQHRHLPATYSHFKETLDMQQTDVAYRLGRLFAVLERIQQQAMPGINATIRDRYYGAASTTPVAVFTTLLRLKNAHLKKLADGPAAYFERLIGEVLEPVTDFPRQLTLPDQGRFALGYYHQRQAFFARKDAADTPTTKEE
ncbi:MAG: type I-C CRISPR-associated protein Cas8c/Csd1 [Burkholderiaceae bacterium]|nr:type I-C CRISPR-associated protein Cas8c/Csd1 [Burkholderiaceae bacterium]